MSIVDAPIRVSLDVTYHCDLTCLHCRTNAGEIPKEILKKTLTSEQLLSLIMELDKLGVLEITLTGGEPTISKSFWEILPEFKKLKRSSITLITNAVSLTEEKIDKILDNGIESVRVSIDGTKEVYAAIRQKDVYDSVLEKCVYMQKRVPNFKILTTVMRHNYDNIFPLVQELYDKGIKRQDLIIVRAHGRGMRNNSLLNEEEIFDLYERVSAFKEKVYKKDFDLNLNAPYLVPVAKDKKVFDVVMYPYLVKNTSLAISATGDVTMSRLYSPVAVGNVKEKSIIDIWSEGRAQLEKESADFSEEDLREIFWGFGKRDSSYTALLDKQIFDGTATK